MINRVSIIGSGISGLAAASVLAKEGHEVVVYEKNEQPGGRLRTFTSAGFRFDMGPSWYWMPDVFERFFSLFKRSAIDYYELVKLDPSFRIFFKNTDIDIPSSAHETAALFEKMERGAGNKLIKFLKGAEFKYRTGMQKLVYKPGNSILEYLTAETMSSAFRMDLLSSMKRHIGKQFRDERIREILEFPVLFLGGLPEDTPAMYSLMNHAQLNLGTWYPQGGMGKITDAMVKLAEENGVLLKYSSPIDRIEVSSSKAVAVHSRGSRNGNHAVISSGDYAHSETLLPEEHRNYKEHYWNKRTFAPSCLIFYVGVSKKIKGLQHHNLFFDTDFGLHSSQIYKKPEWPAAPQFYVCCPGKTDPSVAPPDSENLFILVPIAPGLNDTEGIREQYFDMLIDRIEERTEPFRQNIVAKHSYCLQNFKDDYNAFKGNAYGLANTLSQTAFMKPAIRNKKVRNLFYCGHLTSPGPGLPPSLISGQIAAKELLKELL